MNILESFTSVGHTYYRDITKKTQGSFRVLYLGQYVLCAHPLYGGKTSLRYATRGLTSVALSPRPSDFTLTVHSLCCFVVRVILSVLA